MAPDALAAFPRALNSYADVAGASLAATLAARVQAEPFNAVATVIFLLAIVHTFAAARFSAIHFFSEVELVFGLWAAVLAVAITGSMGWGAARHYLNDTVNYTEALFVVVIMALASTRPIVLLAEAGLRRVARAAGGTPAAWWGAILTIGPLIGSFITEPAAMTICALLLARQFYARQPGVRLRYATIGLLFVNVSIGGTLTHFAAPPVLMVARPWGWGTAFMLTHVGWRAALAIAASTSIYARVFRRELRALSASGAIATQEQPDEEAARVLPVPWWVTAIHLAFMAWTVVNAHYPVLFIAGFLFFLGFARATAAYQSRLDLRTPLLVGFFLGGLVVHGGLQGWWIAPVLARLSKAPLFLGATVLTAFNDNALLTYLATLVPSLDPSLRLAIVQGAVTGGGMTVIANAPNPAGQALLCRYFGGAVSPLGLALGALLPTLIAALLFSL
ncbi:MAG: hypothetical protein JWL71_1683 [Acidobacteria bacterium]|nr:hypothetical protein [Acidobacteriota bacterium]